MIVFHKKPKINKKINNSLVSASIFMGLSIISMIGFYTIIQPVSICKGNHIITDLGYENVEYRDYFTITSLQNIVFDSYEYEEEIVARYRYLGEKTVKFTVYVLILLLEILFMKKLLIMKF